MKKSATLDNSLFFGCAELENLIDQDGKCYSLPCGSSFVTCIVGPDGVGKSILSLAAASTYAAKAGKNDRRVIYASTDLNHSQAITTWNHFGLDRPKSRNETLYAKIDKHSITTPCQRVSKLIDDEVRLSWVSPFRTQSTVLRNKIEKLHSYESIFFKQKDRCVHFLDLAEFSAGDDWGHLNRTLGLLADFPSSEGPHLLIVDAVEGLEAMVGEKDGFGLIRSRRSRLAQMVRIARKVNCSIVFVVEQKDDDVRLDEVFVSDLVLRLRSQPHDRYLLKTVEVEKARSKSHIRGEHELQIRKGNGIFGAADNPPMKFPDAREFAYMQVLPSLHVKENLTKPSGKFKLPLRRFPEPLVDIDRLLRREPGTEAESTSDSRDRVTLVVGESRTLKSRLGFAFLAESFGEDCKHAGALLLSSEGHNREQLEEACLEWKNSINAPDVQLGVREILPSFLSSSELLFRIQTCIREMKSSLKSLAKSNNEKFEAIQLRVLIDNWASILEAHPTLGGDPQILQRIFRVFQHEGVMAMVVSTQPGSPHAQLDLKHEHNVLRFEARRLHCWPVDFYGSRRIAITGSMSRNVESGSYVHELIRPHSSDYLLEVSDDFSVYKDLESGQAKPIELKVKLYSGYSESEDPLGDAYAKHVATLLGDLYSEGNPRVDVVEFEDIDRYEGFRDYIRNLHGSKLDHTLVFQVDEFWGESEVLANLSSDFRQSFAMNNTSQPTAKQTPAKNHTGFQGQFNGLTTTLPVLRNEYIPEENRFPLLRDFGFLLLDHEAWENAAEFRVPSWYKMPAVANGKTYLTPIYGLHDANLNASSGLLWDHFTTKELVRACEQDEISILRDQVYKNLLDIREEEAEQSTITVGEVYQSLKQGALAETPTSVFVPWSLFLQASQTVARNAGKRSFDVDLRTRETLNSLVLEVWLSLLKQRAPSIGQNLEMLRSDGEFDSFDLMPGSTNLDPKQIAEAHHSLAMKISKQEADYVPSVSEMLRDEVSRAYLFDALSLLSGFLPSRFREAVLETGKPESDAVAIRTWYGSSAVLQEDRRSLVPVRLPGSYSVRGDWYLGIAKGSRSMRLAERAVGNLVSSSMSMKRYRAGVGLPVTKSQNIDLAESIVTTTDGTRPKGMSLREIDNLGPSCRSPFSPIFRSKFENYGKECDDFFLLVAHLLRVIPPCDDVSNPILLEDWEGMNDAILQCEQVAASCDMHTQATS